VAFCSVLFDSPERKARAEGCEEPPFFRDLNLDQVVGAVTAGREEYRLLPFFWAPLDDADAVAYRHEVFRDLEETALREGITSFAEKMRYVRAHLEQADKLYYLLQKERWFLDAVGTYIQAVLGLREALVQSELRSRALRAFRQYLCSYVESPTFVDLSSRHAELEEALAGVTYCVHIDGNRIRVSRYSGQRNYAEEVEATFAKFKEGVARDYRTKFPSWPDMNHVEAGVLERVALLYPDLFSALDDYFRSHQGFIEQTVADFDREIQFYMAYAEFVRRFVAAGLPFCYPRVSNQSKEVSASEAFDVALAAKLLAQGSMVVSNEFHLKDPERILVVTGPNQGGKTTFARSFGQIHYLAALGCPVPGRQASLFLFDLLFTHFEKEETLASLSGKLEDELVRVHEIIARATPGSIVILNEPFSSTTLRDALFLGKKVLERVSRLDLLCVYVTFVDELASFNEKTVSLVGMVAPDNPAVRTFKIVRRPADGHAYAAAIAARHGLTYQQLRERIRQ